MENDKKLDLALWRYGIISPLLHRNAEEVRFCELLDLLSFRTYIHPCGECVKLSAETIRKWYYRYKSGGLKSLEDKQRSDKGYHDVPESIADEMEKLRKEHPGWTVALMLKELTERKLWDETRPSRSVLYRFANANDLMRQCNAAGGGVVRPFEFTMFGQMWIADFMHGPHLWFSDKKRKSYLHAILDDCTRYVVSGNFYPSESTEMLIGDLMCVTRRYGIAERFYSDNGAAYNSRYLKIVCANLGVQQPHTPPRRPQGRSKVERFFRTVRDQFLAKRKYKSFEDINQAFHRFLHDYHHRKHSSLSCSPMQKRMGVKSVCRQIPEVVDIEALFRLTRQCKVYNDGTIRLNKRKFEVPGCLAGSRVTIHYMPWDLNRVYYGDEMNPAKEVNLGANAHRFTNPNFSAKKEQDNE